MEWTSRLGTENSNEVEVTLFQQLKRVWSVSLRKAWKPWNIHPLLTMFQRVYLYVRKGNRKRVNWASAVHIACDRGLINYYNCVKIVQILWDGIRPRSPERQGSWSPARSLSCFHCQPTRPTLPSGSWMGGCNTSPRQCEPHQFCQLDIQSTPPWTQWDDETECLDL